MKTVTPVLSEKVVAVLQQSLDSHLKAHGLAAFDAVAVVVQALNVPWDAPAEPKPETAE